MKVHLHLATEDYARRQSDANKNHVLELLLDGSSRDVVSVARDGDACSDAFVWAGYQGHVDVLQAFINCGMNVNVKRSDTFTALMSACSFGREECVRLLLSHNASVNEKSEHDETAMILASQYGYTRIVELLLDHNGNPDIQNKYGYTALMGGSSYGSEELVQLLLSRNVDVDLKNQNGKTALDLATTEAIKEMFRNHVTNNGYVLK